MCKMIEMMRKIVFLSIYAMIGEAAGLGSFDRQCYFCRITF